MVNESCVVDGLDRSQHTASISKTATIALIAPAIEMNSEFLIRGVYVLWEMHTGSFMVVL